jgi:hypothetical protein
MTDILDFDFNEGDFCPDRRDDIITYVFKEMGPGASEAFQAHLASCDGCREEVDSLDDTLRIVAESSSPLPYRVAGSLSSPQAHEVMPANGDGVSWEEEWALLRRRLLAGEAFSPEEIPAAEPRRAGVWIAWAASVAVIGALAFSAGLWRGVSLSAAVRSQVPGLTGEGVSLPPVAGASIGNYFDNLDDFTRDTHNFFRRTRMVLMEFSNLGSDSDPTFFRESCSELLTEVTRYQEVARRVQSRKLGDLLDQIAGILTAISRVDQANQKQVIADVKLTLNMTGLIGTLDLLDTTSDRGLKRHSNV